MPRRRGSLHSGLPKVAMRSSCCAARLSQEASPFMQGNTVTPSREIWYDFYCRHFATLCHMLIYRISLGVVMTILRYRYIFCIVIIYVLILIFAIHVYADKDDNNERLIYRNDIIDRIKSIAVEGVSIDEVVDKGREVTILGLAQDNKNLSGYMRALSREVGLPNLHYVKRDRQGDMPISRFSISIKKPKEGG